MERMSFGSSVKSEADKSPEKERGANVSIHLKIMRHGERDKEGSLLDYGREMTREAAKQSKEILGSFDAVKAVGSDAGPHHDGMGRARETAAIYADEVAEDGTLRIPRERDVLSYETLLSKVPYDHVAVYNSHLPENYNDLSGKEKAEAAQIAQKKVVEHLWNLDTDEAKVYRKEIAGAYAVFVLHYADMLSRLKSGSKVLVPAGTHGGMMELLLREAMTDENGKSNWTLDEIGGDFNPSEGFSVNLSTDADGLGGTLEVCFDQNSPVGKERPQGKFILDRLKLEELARFYRKLHL